MGFQYGVFMDNWMYGSEHKAPKGRIAIPSIPGICKHGTRAAI